MKSTQIIVLGVALAAAGGAGYLALNMGGPSEVVQRIVEEAPMARVLVAAEPIPIGEALGIERIRWMDWPESGLTEGLVIYEGDTPDFNAADPDAIASDAAAAPVAAAPADEDAVIEEYAQKISRASILIGEPIRAERLVSSDRGYMSAILPSGHRAVALRVEPLTASGGFVLPNDHVDVKASMVDEAGQENVETILENVRVLAIDQLIEETEDGQKSVLGDTATLELTAEEVDAIVGLQTRQAQGGRGSRITVNLVLRSVADAGQRRDLMKSNSGKKTQFQMIRYGQKQTVRIRK